MPDTDTPLTADDIMRPVDPADPQLLEYTLPAVDFELLHDMAGPIEYATKGSACVDLRACFERGCMTVMPGSTALIPSGVKVAIPEGYVGLLFIRSGVSVKRGLRLVNGVGVIDSDYRGEVHIPVTSEAVNGTYLEQGERIAQLGFFPVHQLPVRIVKSLPETERGDGGIGSTGNT